jgi:hypothetical protein
MHKRLQQFDSAPDEVVLGPDGAPLALSSLWADGPVVLAFLRHFG